ncbi:SET domain-containing protein 4-like [Daphnia carinata]|uniref:SET domain-containing protein 4-like n=1 Tax=Daphnia carinata TaxID=120202 RepID=UPI002868823C|nr:SET domain-containing protein 4-like [Daphnia carinata]
MGRTSRIGKRRIESQCFRPVVIDSNPEFVELCKWMSANRWNAASKDCLKTKPGVFSDTGRGLMAMSNLAPNSLIVRIPKNLLITKANGDWEHYFESNRMTTAECLTFFILISKINGLYSSYYVYLASLHYLSTLSKSFSVGGLCESQEVAVLPKVLRDKIICNQSYVVEKYETLLVIWEKNFGPNLTLESFQWAWYCVNTRAVFYQDSDTFNVDGLENNMALAPYLDMFNHDPHVVVEARFKKNSQCYKIRSSQKIKKHQQVFINYGPHDNQKLFLEYGFITKKNPHNVIEFGINLLFDLFPVHTLRFVPNRIALLKQFCKDGNLFYSEEGFSWNAQIALTLLSRDDSQLSRKGFSILEIIPDKYQIKVFGKKVVDALFLEFTESVNKMSLVSGNTTSSFWVAKTLVKDILNVLSACVLDAE